MSKVTTRRAIMALAFCILAFRILAFRILTTLQLTNGIYHLIDPHSDANCIRAGLGYYDEGFSKFYGLPDMVYDRSTAKSPDRVIYIYTHYPDGAELITGLSYYLWGDKDERLLRIIPFLFSSFGMLFFFFCLYRFFEDGRAFWISLFVSILPMFTNMMNNLAYHGYAFSLMLIQLGLGLLFYKRFISNRRYVILACVCGFAHGLFALDYFFVSSLACSVFYIWREGIKFDRTLVKLWVLPAMSFGLAFFFHFLQVVGYSGLTGAIEDYTKSGLYRLYGEGSTLTWVDVTKLTPWNVLRVQVDIFISKKENYHGPVQVLIVGIWLASFLYKRVRSFKVGPWQFKWSVTKNDALAISAVLVVGVLWTLVMRHHSYIHFFIARHFFVPLFLCLVVFAQSLSVSRK